MKKLIEELALQAGYTPLPGFDFANELQEVFLKKFADTIVNECMTTMLKESKWYWDKDEFESSNAIQNATRRVKEHFGVE